MGVWRSAKPLSGGIVLSRILGVWLGVAEGMPMKGILIGTGIGIAAALLLWLIDRRN